MKNKIVVLCGKSAVGKSAIANYLSEHYGYKIVISTTSRPPRPKEQEGIDYYFTTENNFKQMLSNNEILEYRRYAVLKNGKPAIWFYGTHRDSIHIDEPKEVVILDIGGLKELKKIYPKNIISFYITIDDSERDFRGRNRDGFDKDEWNRRWIDDEKSFAPQIVAENVDFIVENYVLENCVKNIMYNIKQIERK